jgi:hypothetical protein
VSLILPLVLFIAYWFVPKPVFFGLTILHVADLRKASPNAGNLYWLNPPNISNLSGGASPTERLGVVQRASQIYTHQFGDSSRHGLVLPGGWQVELGKNDLNEPKTCLAIDLTLRWPQDNSAVTWRVEKERQSGLLSRHISCMGGSADVFNTVVLNSRFFAFNTSEPGWIFFDRYKGEFLPLIVKGNPNHTTNLYANDRGEIFIDIEPDHLGSTAMTWIDRRADGLRIIPLLMGKVDGSMPKINPLTPKDLREIKALNEKLRCQMAMDYGRPCKPQ